MALLERSPLCKPSAAECSLVLAIVIDEAHRAARLKLISAVCEEVPEIRAVVDLGLAGSQRFECLALFRYREPSGHSAIGSYLVLRMTVVDARALARVTSTSADEKQTADRLKSLERYTALFFTEALPRSVRVRLVE